MSCIAFVDLIGSKMETVLGHVEVELDGRFSAIRTSETNLGWFSCFVNNVLLIIACLSTGKLLVLKSHSCFLSTVWFR